MLIPDTFEHRSLSEALAGKGVRLTTQRRILVEIIQGSGHHINAATLLEKARMKDPEIGRATVYRTIRLLTELRLREELNSMHFRERGRGNLRLACFQCGRSEELSSPVFESCTAPISKEPVSEIRAPRLEVRGRCRACRCEPLNH